jgi:hypothetical protein
MLKILDVTNGLVKTIKNFRMKIQEQLILDIQKLSPQMVFQVYNFTEQLHKLVLINDKQKKIIDFNNHPFKKYFGIISDDEAQELRACITDEFDRLEGEW